MRVTTPTRTLVDLADVPPASPDIQAGAPRS
jgi:hypothetical protein